MSKNQQMKRAKEKYYDYRNSYAYCLEDVYGSHSIHKTRAWRYCNELMQKYCGCNLKIISYNKNIFTAGFEFTNESGKLCFMYITPNYDIDIEL